jgi:glycerol-3-phosphate acyltransferase PlsY
VGVAAYGLAVVAGYLAGSVPVAVLVGRRHGVDPRRAGDRNPGWWNMRALVGDRAALPVFAGDVAKGTVAGLAGWAAAAALGGGRPVVYAGVAAAMIGHAWPVFGGFRGGRSILTFVGGMLVIAPAVFAVSGGLFLATWAVTRRLAWAARVAVFGAPVVQAIVDGWRWGAATFLLMSIIGLRFGMAAVSERSGGSGAGGASGRWRGDA